MFGKKQSKEAKHKLSVRRQGKSNPAFGKMPWNKGLTKNTDSRVAKYATTRRGIVPWNKGLPSEHQAVEAVEQ
jgi:hypothetical protein